MKNIFKNSIAVIPTLLLVGLISGCASTGNRESTIANPNAETHSGVSKKRFASAFKFAETIPKNEVGAVLYLEKIGNTWSIGAASKDVRERNVERIVVYPISRVFALQYDVGDLTRKSGRCNAKSEDRQQFGYFFCNTNFKLKQGYGVGRALMDVASGGMNSASMAQKNETIFELDIENLTDVVNSADLAAALDTEAKVRNEKVLKDARAQESLKKSYEEANRREREQQKMRAEERSAADAQAMAMLPKHPVGKTMFCSSSKDWLVKAGDPFQEIGFRCDLTGQRVLNVRTLAENGWDIVGETRQPVDLQFGGVGYIVELRVRKSR